MNKQIAAVALAGVVVLAGCQNLQDQMGSKLAESIINSSTGGEVKVNIQDLQNGKMTVTTKDGTIQMDGNGANGGSMKMTDANGKTITTSTADGKNFVVNDEKGNTVMTANDNSVTMKGDDGTTSTFKSSESTRPSEIPADMPTLDGGSTYSYIGAGGSMTVSYSFKDKDFKAVCDKQTAALTGAGWASADDSFSMNTSDLTTKTLTKGNDSMSLTCSSADDSSTITMSRAPVVS